jgi:hypothetical protein
MILEVLFDVVVYRDGDYEIRPTARTLSDGGGIVASQLAFDSCADLVRRLIADQRSTGPHSATGGDHNSHESLCAI